MMNLADLAGTGLIAEASRAEHRLLVAGDAEAVERFRRDIEPLPARCAWWTAPAPGPNSPPPWSAPGAS